MMRTLLCIAGLALFLTAAPAQEARGQEAPTYTVKEGDTLYSLSRRYGLTVAELQRLNGLSGTTIRIGQELVVGTTDEAEEPPAEEPPAEEPPAEEPPAEEPPAEEPPAEEPPAEERMALDVRIGVDTSGPSASGAAEDPEAVADSSAAPGGALFEPIYGEHVVEAGETLYGLAARYGLAADTLRALNPDVPLFLAAGDALRLPPSKAAGVRRVAEGETLYDVAAAVGVSVRRLQQVNNLDSREVQAGQYLRIPGPEPEGPPPGVLPPVQFSGSLLRYPDAFAGRLTASGRPYDPESFIVSHAGLPLGAVVLLTNPASGRSTFAEVADRGPLDDAYVMDASAAVLRQLGLAPESAQPVEVRVIDK